MIMRTCGTTNRRPTASRKAAVVEPSPGCDTCGAASTHSTVIHLHPEDADESAVFWSCDRHYGGLLKATKALYGADADRAWNPIW